MLCKLFISSSLEEVGGFLSFEDFNKVLCRGIGGWCFPDGVSSKDIACQCGRHEALGSDLRVGKIPQRKPWQPIPVCSPGDSPVQRTWHATVQSIAQIKPDWSDLAHRRKNGEGMTFQGHSCCDNTARKLGFQVTVIRTIYVRHQALHEHMAGTRTLECMYRLHHYVCVTSVLYICHKERMRPVIIFLLDWQMKLWTLEKRQTLYLPETHKLQESGSKCVRINFFMLGNVINISAVTSNNVRFKNKYQICSCLEMF